MPFFEILHVKMIFLFSILVLSMYTTTTYLVIFQFLGPNYAQLRKLFCFFTQSRHLISTQCSSLFFASHHRIKENLFLRQNIQQTNIRCSRDQSKYLIKKYQAKYPKKCIFASYCRTAVCSKIRKIVLFSETAVCLIVVF